MPEIPPKGSPPGPQTRRSGAIMDLDETVLIPVGDRRMMLGEDGDRTVPRGEDQSARYLVQEMIGQGSMAEVFKAFHTRAQHEFG